MYPLPRLTRCVAQAIQHVARRLHKRLAMTVFVLFAFACLASTSACDSTSPDSKRSANAKIAARAEKAMNGERADAPATQEANASAPKRAHDDTDEPIDSATPQRIGTIAPNAAEMIAALGAADRIVGVSSFCVYPPELLQRPRVGGIMDPDLEKIVSLKPDLLVLRGEMPTVTKLAQRLNIRVYQDRTETLDDIYTTLHELGALLDTQTEADELIASIKSDIAAIRQRIDTQLKSDNRPTVLFVVGRDPAGVRNVVTVGKNTFVSEIIRLAGGRGAFETSTVDYPQLNAEAIIAAQPDVIIEVADPATPPTELAARQTHWRALGNNLPAVRNGRIYILTDDYLLIPSPRVVQSITSLADVLHPAEGAQR